LEDMMTNARQLHTLKLGLRVSAATGAVALAIVFALTMVASQAVQAQTFKVIHNFTGAQDGSFPLAGVTMDKAGNLYGTASSGGNGNGTVYRLKRSGSNWIVQPLYSFNQTDGAFPEARVIFGPDGTLYGTTTYGGTANEGAVFRLRPPATACKTALCPWVETVLYDFSGGNDGASPGYGDLLFDQAGNIYGTTGAGGLLTCYPGGCGTVYELTPSGGGWMESVLYSFGTGGGADGAFPFNGLIPDSAGNLYSTTSGGGTLGVTGLGTVFQLTPPGSGWTENILYDFQNATGNPSAGLVFDQNGNLYGATTNGGSGGGGTVFQLTLSGGTWNLTTLYNFTGSPGCGPYGTLAIDAAGDTLYGTTYCAGANNAGSIFKLTNAGGSWTYTPLHDFADGSDGGYPTSSVILDANSNLYGTATQGGSQGRGVAWEITP
jgi:uncharacterized repeat protein (TIGR03803 family)